MCVHHDSQCEPGVYTSQGHVRFLKNLNSTFHCLFFFKILCSTSVPSTKCKLNCSYFIHPLRFPLESIPFQVPLLELGGGKNSSEKKLPFDKYQICINNTTNMFNRNIQKHLATIEHCIFVWYIYLYYIYTYINMFYILINPLTQNLAQASQTSASFRVSTNPFEKIFFKMGSSSPK